MSPLLCRSGIRYLRRHPWQLGLTVLGVALGVAVSMAVDLAVDSARRGFTVSAEAVAGRATHRIVAGPAGLPDTLFRRVRAVPAVRAAAPVVEAELELAGTGRLVRLLGIDPLSEAPFRSLLGGGGPSAGLRAASVLLSGRVGALSRETADRIGVALGGTIRLERGGRVEAVRVGAILEPGDALSRTAMQDLLLVDIATAQALLDRNGLDRIDLIVVGDEAAALRALADVLPASASIAPAGAGTAALREMTRAFELNLRSLGLLALVFGVFLIYNSATFSVVQRRGLFGALRSLGVTRREILSLVMLESLLVGAAGTALGTVLGVGLARQLLGLVTRTINDLYFVTTVRDLDVTPAALAGSVVLGLGAVLAGALPAAIEASMSPPRTVLLRSELESRVRRAVPLAAAAGLGLGLLGGALLLPAGPLELTFAGVLLIILGCALLVPIGTLALMRLVKPIAGRVFGPLGRLAAGGVVQALSRTAPAIAALSIAIAVAVGVGVMIDSFRDTVSRWLEVTLQADVYVSPPEPTRAAEGSIIVGAAALRIAALPDVAGVRYYRRAEVDAPKGAVALLAVTVDSVLERSLILQERDPADIWPAFLGGRGVLVSEPLAFRRGLRAGDTLWLRTRSGPRPFPVLAVYRDYGSERGAVMIELERYRDAWADSAISSLAVFVTPGAAPADVAESVRGAAAAIQPLRAQSNRDLRQASLRIFDRTFAITGVLRVLALMVAFVGVVSALMALQLERARELGVLRATGFTPGQVGALVTAQTGLMGLTAGLLALPFGVGLALLMIHVVNRRSFGWSIDLVLGPGQLAEAVLVAVAAAVLAGLYPAFRMARTAPAAALREEW